METELFHSPLVDAAKKGLVDEIKKLSEACVNSETKKQELYPALYIAAYQGHENVVKILLSKGADPSFCLENCLPPLHAAAQKGRVSVAKLLLDHGAAINPKLRIKSEGSSEEFEESDYFSSPLLTAARGGHEKMVKLLLERGADINVKLRLTTVKVSDEIERIFTFGDYSKYDISSNSKIIGYTPLHFAVEAGEKSVVLLLIQNGANVNTESEKGLTPISIAKARKEQSILRVLVRENLEKYTTINGLSLLNQLILRNRCNSHLKRKHDDVDEELTTSESKEGDSEKSTDKEESVATTDNPSQVGCNIL